MKFRTTTICMLALAAFACCAHAQTFQVIHYFTGGADGAYPGSALIIDRAGHIYGTAGSGGMGNNGTVFELTHHNSSWIFSPIYEFAGGNDGSSPDGVVFGPEGLIYGATFFGGGTNDAGIAYALQPPATVCKTTTCFWSETILHSFGSGTDGANPASGLISDQAGNLYGTTEAGGTAGGYGTVYKLSKSGNMWAEETLYSLAGPPNDGWEPVGGLIFDSSGNLYGTTVQGGANGDGTTFELMPSNGSWGESILYNFSNNSVGHYPSSAFVMDQVGNLYSTTWINGSVFELTRSNGQWNASPIYTAPHFGSIAPLTMDQSGNLYGVSGVGSNGGNDSGDGFVFKLRNSNGAWTIADLHDFNGSDGKTPAGPVTLDSAGNLWGTAEFGGQGCGSNGCGAIWEITP